MHYPATGYRASDGGALNAVGTDGYSWSSSPFTATTLYASNILSGNTHIYPESNYHNRAAGFPVRCVQE